MNSKTTIDGARVALTIPEGFHLLNEEDCAEIGRTPSTRDWAVRNTEQHLIYNVAWRKIPRLGKLFGIDLLQTVNNTSARFSKLIPTYRTLGTVNRSIAGQEALGFRYAYTVEDVHMMSEYLLIQHGGNYCAFHCLAREETFEEYYSCFEALLASVELL